MTSVKHKRGIELEAKGNKKAKLITDFFVTKAKPKTETKVETTKVDAVEAEVDCVVEPFDDDYEKFATKYNFEKQKWVNSLSEEEKVLLQLEIETLHISWLVFLHKELTKPYFLKLKKFLQTQKSQGKTIFPPQDQIYSWSHYTPLPKIKCLILGQDPYHNFNQAHGLAFSVLEPTRPPPSLVNIYKTLKIDFPEFETPKSGDLTAWAKRGILMLNAALTVEAHKANSHAKQGWETFTEEVIKTAINFYKKENKPGFVIMAWGTPAQNRVLKFQALLYGNGSKFCVLKSVHPSPLSASRGFFDSKVFKKCNEWLESVGQAKLDWGLIEGNVIQ